MAEEYQPLTTWCQTHYPSTSAQKFGRGINKLDNIKFLSSDATVSISTPLPPIESNKTTIHTYIPSYTYFCSIPNRPVSLGHHSQKRLRLELPEDLGKCICEDCSLLEELGWETFVRSKRGTSNFDSLNFNHPEK